MVATIADKDYAVFNLDGTFYVLDNACVHRGGPLGESDLDGDIITCPWHGWQYHVKTGRCLNKDGVAVICYDVTVDGGDITIALP